MAIRKADAVWQGTLREGQGTMRLGSGAFEGAYTFASRFEEGEGTNPEELLGAAHAGCFSMFLAAVLTSNGYPPERIQTAAKVHIERVDGSPKITIIELTTEAAVPDVDEATFLTHAENAKKGCPVSKALTGVDIRLNARLV
ncbi:MAG: OsmC family protein [Chloroflexota bacterium]